MHEGSNYAANATLSRANTAALAKLILAAVPAFLASVVSVVVVDVEVDVDVDAPALPLAVASLPPSFEEVEVVVSLVLVPSVDTEEDELDPVVEPVSGSSLLTVMDSGTANQTISQAAGNGYLSMVIYFQPNSCNSRNSPLSPSVIVVADAVDPLSVEIEEEAEADDSSDPVLSATADALSSSAEAPNLDPTTQKSRSKSYPHCRSPTE